MATSPFNTQKHLNGAHDKKQALEQSQVKLQEILGLTPTPGFLHAVANRVPSNVLGFQLLAKATEVPETASYQLDTKTKNALREIRLKIHSHPNLISRYSHWPHH